MARRGVWGNKFWDQAPWYLDANTNCLQWSLWPTIFQHVSPLGCRSAKRAYEKWSHPGVTLEGLPLPILLPRSSPCPGHSCSPWKPTANTGEILKIIFDLCYLERKCLKSECVYHTNAKMLPLKWQARCFIKILLGFVSAVALFQMEVGCKTSICFLLQCWKKSIVLGLTNSKFKEINLT